MLTDLQRDILIKSREGIQEGLWCQGSWFTEGLDEEGCSVGRSLGDDDFFYEYDMKGVGALEAVARFHRCAEGEIAFRTMQVGGTENDYGEILGAIVDHLEETCAKCHKYNEPSVESHNDRHMDGLDKLEGGQEWARIFDAVITNSLL